MKIYFGSKYIVTTIIFIPRLSQFHADNENTEFALIKENGEEEYCGILTGVNVGSKKVEDQTYRIPCDYKEGVGIKVWIATGSAFRPAEISISYSDRE